MKLTYPGKDYIVINESNIKEEELINLPKIHLIHLNFKIPTQEKIDAVLMLFNKTNRFVISNNIKFYNDILKKTTKKYYVMNNIGDNLITFFRRNNKVLLNLNNLRLCEKEFVCQNIVLQDILKNIEVIQLHKKLFLELSVLFDSWDGNVIIED